MRKKALKRFMDCLEILLEHCESNEIAIALENVVPIPQGSENIFLGDKK